MNTNDPLWWDLLWLAVFGILPLASGWLLLRRRPPSKRLLTSPIVLVLGVLTTAPIAALPSSQQTTVVVLFAPGVSSIQAAGAIANAGGAIVWVDPSSQIWAADFSNGGDPARLYLHGALLVSTSFLAVGCLGWVKA